MREVEAEDCCDSFCDSLRRYDIPLAHLPAAPDTWPQHIISHHYHVITRCGTRFKPSQLPMSISYALSIPTHPLDQRATSDLLETIAHRKTHERSGICIQQEIN